MRKNSTLISEADIGVATDELSERTLRYLERVGMTPADLERAFRQMQQALECLPDRLDNLTLGFFVKRLFDAYEIAPEQRIMLLMEIAASTDGVDAEVKRVRLGPDGEVEEEETLCTCPVCQAEREVEATERAERAASPVH